MKVVLELQDQPASVRRVTVRHDIVIGRGADCNLRLSAPQISRRHCFLRVGRDGVSVTDLDSSNGTFVDGERLRSGVRQPLRHGSQLSLGSVRFVVHIRDESAPEEGAKSSAEKHRKATAKSASEPSTIIADVDAELRNARAMNLFAEHPGPATASREEVVDVAGERVATSVDVAKKRSAQLSNIDSRAEIVDLGRQLIAAEEKATNESFTKASRSDNSQKLSAAGSTPFSPAEASSKRTSLPVPTVVDTDDAPADMSFFNDIAAEKTNEVPDSADDQLVEEVFDVAEVVEELPDEHIEVVDDEEVLEVAEVIEEVEEAVEVIDDDAVRGQDSATAGNVMSLDDDWEDPDAPARKRRSGAAGSPTSSGSSQAARAAGLTPVKPSGQSKISSDRTRNVAPADLLPPAIPEVMDDVELVEEFDEVIEVLDDEIAEVRETEGVDVVQDFEFEDAAEPAAEESAGPAQFGSSGQATAETSSATNDDDDIDPNLRDFLKGF